MGGKKRNKFLTLTMEMEDEDVILPVTDLGKYAEALNVFGHFDVLDPSHFESNSDCREHEFDEERTCQTYVQQYGFICGQNLPEIKTCLLPSNIARMILPASEYLMVPLNFAAKCIYLLVHFYEVLIKKAIDLVQIVKLFLPRKLAKTELSKAERVAFKFSLEHRLSNECSQLIEASAQIGTSVEQLNRLIVKLQNLKINKSNYLAKRNSITQEILRTRDGIANSMRRMERVLICQENSIERFSRRTNYLPQNCVPSEPPVPEEAMPLQEEQMETENSLQQSPLYFETEALDEFSTESNYTSRDEFLELDMEAKGLCVPEYNLAHDEDTFDREVKVIQAELLEQLRKPLQSRRAEMEAREVGINSGLKESVVDEARSNSVLHNARNYTAELNGNASSSVEEQLPFNLFSVDPKLLPQPVFNRDASETLLGEEENFGDDDIDESESQELKTEFLASLQTLLRKRREC